MTDIVERLRRTADFITQSTGEPAKWVREAADEIERLRTKVKQLEGQPRILNSNRNSFM